ncbi:MAG: hypothetical protein LUC34_02555 [Campylobacter sp.]|nr:hypothetical protein [Campylobacter sp.]
MRKYKKFQRNKSRSGFIPLVKTPECFYALRNGGYTFKIVGYSYPDGRLIAEKSLRREDCYKYLASLGYKEFENQDFEEIDKAEKRRITFKKHYSGKEQDDNLTNDVDYSLIDPKNKTKQ